MKKILGFSAVLFCLAACKGGSDRVEQKESVETSFPATGAGQNNDGGMADTSVGDTQDSTTSVAFDTSAVRKN